MKRHFNLILLAAVAAMIAGTPAAPAGSTLDRPAFVLGPTAAATFDGGRPFHGTGGDEVLLLKVAPTCFQVVLRPGQQRRRVESGRASSAGAPRPVTYADHAADIGLPA